MVTLKSLTTDVVKPMTAIETVGAGILGGMLGNLATKLPLPAVVIAGGEIVAGMLISKNMGGKLGVMAGNGLTIAGAYQFSAMIINMITGATSTSTSTDTTDNSTLF